MRESEIPMTVVTSDQAAPPPAVPGIAAWRMVLSGVCALLVGIGIARFAYTPLIPALIGAGWFSAGDAAYLGAANLAGYLAGVLGALGLARRLGVRPVLRGMMLATAVSLLACAAPLGFGWVLAWRLVSGIGGGMVMVLAAPAILLHIPPRRRGAVGGLIFMGVGLGVAASGTLVPLLLARGLSQTWLGLGILCLALTLLAWSGWPAGPAPAAGLAAADEPVPPEIRTALRRINAQYALNALAVVPHMVFLVDFIARGLGQGMKAAAVYWIAFGLGAVAGPLSGGALADRIGARWALRAAWLLQIAALLLIMVDHSPATLVFSAAIMGAFTPGMVALALSRITELTAGRPALQKRAWSTATTGFAAFQAIGAYGASFILASGGSYTLLFGIAAGALGLALALEGVGAGRRP
ncbi:MAG: major facilitator superfamily 1 [Caulobacteraceae bacterium]|nr:major facilitator superfamily 1 [Caulobacteraceae bacterium]